jgi:hypothetical protein
MNYLRILLLSVVLTGMMAGASYAADPEVEAYLAKVQTSGAVSDLNLLFDMGLSESGPASPETLEKIGKQYGDLAYRNEDQDHFLRLSHKAASLVRALDAPLTEQDSGRTIAISAGVSGRQAIAELNGINLGAQHPGEDALAPLYSIVAGEDYDEAEYLGLLARAQGLLTALRTDPAFLSAHNRWTGAAIPQQGAVPEADVAAIYGLVGDVNFSTTIYSRLLPKAVIVWDKLNQRHLVDDFNLIYNTNAVSGDPAPDTETRGHIMGIVGGFWGAYITNQGRFNFFNVLHQAAEYYRMMQTDPGRLIRYNKRHGASAPPLSATGGIADAKSREKYLSLAAEAVKKNRPITRHLSSFQ